MIATKEFTNTTVACMTIAIDYYLKRLTKRLKMKQLNMTLARHNELKAQYRGKVAGIHQELEGAGFDVKRDYSVGHDKETGDLIFMQAEPIVEKNPVKVSMAKAKKKGGIFSKKAKK